MSAVAADGRAHGVKLTTKRKTLLKTSLASRDETAEPVIKAVHRKCTSERDELRGLYQDSIGGKSAVIEYEPDSELRDTEQVPLLHQGGIEAFLRERGAALRTGRLVCARQRQGWIRNQLHPPLLQTAAHASAGGDTG